MNPEPKPQKVGGFSFFFSVFSLLIANFLLGILVFGYLGFFSLRGFSIWRWLILGVAIGLGLATQVIRGKFRVFLHELKHSIPSSLVGNKAKSLNFEDTSGHFEYQYTTQTASYNALIALAPYSLPLFTLVILPLSHFFVSQSLPLSVLLVGIAYGMDLYSGLIDVSSLQPDFQSIRGGFRIGVTYVLLSQLFTLNLVLCWCLFT